MAASRFAPIPSCAPGRAPPSVRTAPGGFAVGGAPSTRVGRCADPASTFRDLCSEPRHGIAVLVPKPAKASGRLRLLPDHFSVGARQDGLADQIGHSAVQNHNLVLPTLLQVAPSACAAVRCEAHS